MTARQRRRGTRLVPQVPSLLARHMLPLSNAERMAAVDQLNRQVGMEATNRILAETIRIMDATKEN